MRASTDPAGMTDDELETAGRHHATLAESYRGMAKDDTSTERAASCLRLADRHQAASDACNAEAKRRGQ